MTPLPEANNQATSNSELSAPPNDKTVKLDRAIGSIVGLAVADALGSTVEFMTPEEIKKLYGPGGHTEMRGGGKWYINWDLGEYTDDGQMMMCLLESLVATNQAHRTKLSIAGLDVDDLGRRFEAWYDSAPKDVGITVSKAIHRMKDGIPASLSGDPDPQSQANGAVMRCAPVGVLWNNPYYRTYLIRDSLLSAVPTHRSPVAMGTCVIVNTMIAEFINGADFETALTAAVRAAEGEWHAILVKWEQEGRPHRGNSGWAVSTVLTALHCLYTTSSFEAAVVKAVNGGDDADTVGAVTGELAGAFYGASAIPARWTAVLKDHARMVELAQTLFEISER